jgi:hypothetical protein
MLWTIGQDTSERGGGKSLGPAKQIATHRGGVFQA